jgi:hypothetical protein
MVTTCNTIIFVITKTFCILQEYYKKLKALDRIATFLNGPQRKLLEVAAFNKSWFPS